VRDHYETLTGILRCRDIVIGIFLNGANKNRQFHSLIVEFAGYLQKLQIELLNKAFSFHICVQI
jgi:hypothetical protein